MAKNYDSLSDIWKLKKRGKRDSERHKELVEKAIRKNGKDVITEYNIIKSDGNKKVKIPIKFLDKYRVKYGKLNNQGGTGQGVSGKPGDQYRMKPGKPGNGGPGQEEGERIFEAEITVDELVNILMEELNLPWMDPNNATQIEVKNEEITSINRTGIFPNLDLKRSLLENIKRNAAKGNPKLGKWSKEDLRYKVWEEEFEYHSNAVVYLMMDRSGSMDQEKTHIAKSFYFWMVQFLKKRYKKVDLIFIAHDAKAFIVDEEEFFKISASGGTQCSSAFQLAYDHMKRHYLNDNVNRYVYEFSDGDNWPSDNELCVEIAKKMMPMVKAMGYGEIMLNKNANPWFKEEQLLSSYFNEQINRTRFISMQFKSKDDVFVGLKKFFNVDGVSKKGKK